jgi:hypothetical protein
VRKAVSESEVKRIVSSEGFTLAIDERFRNLMDYLHSEVIPKEIRKHLGGGPRGPAVTDTHIT